MPLHPHDSSTSDCNMNDSASADLEKDWDADFFLDDFKKYMLAELSWERKCKGPWGLGPKEQRDWVFWSRDDGKLPLHKDNSDINFNRETATALLADRLKKVLQFILRQRFLERDRLLVQCWAHRTVEGQSLLTCKNEPFALRSFARGRDIDGLCRYRKISEEHIIYLDDLKSSNERLRPIRRAFVNGCGQKSTLNVEYYYPLPHNDFHGILKACYAVPLLQYSKASSLLQYSKDECGGVLEIVSTTEDIAFTGRCVCFGPNILECFGLYFGRRSYSDFDSSDQESLDGANNESNVGGAEQSNIVSRFLQQDLSDQESLDGAKNESNVVGAEQSNIGVTRCSPGPEPLQNGGLDLGDQQLVDGANHGNNVAGAEQSNADVAHSRKKGTRKEPKKGEKTTGTGIEITLQEIEQCSAMTLNAAAEKLKVSRSTLKRIRKSHGIKKWHPHEIKRVCRAGIASKSLPRVYQTPKLNSNRSQTWPCDMVMQDNNSNNKVTIKAKYDKINLKFQLSMPPTVEELQQEVAKRLYMEAGTYHIQYEEVEDGDIITICIDSDLQDYVAACASKGVTSVVLFLSKNI